MLSEWAIMRSEAGLVINYYGPMEAQLSLGNGLPGDVRQETIYPLDGNVKIEIQVKEPQRVSRAVTRPELVATDADSLPFPRPAAFCRPLRRP